MDNNELSTNLAEVGTDAISRQAAIDLLKQMRKDGDMIPWEGKDVFARIRKLPSAQPYTTTPDGRLWITVDDIDKVTAVVVDEHKSKFCKQFYEDAEPDIIRCKDCKNWDTTWTNDFSPSYHYCPMVDGVRKEDWFCADAERRTDG